jgi:hypothetical protein
LFYQVHVGFNSGLLLFLNPQESSEEQEHHPDEDSYYIGFLLCFSIFGFGGKIHNQSNSVVFGVFLVPLI